MNGRDDRIEDVRPTPLVRIDAAAFDLIPSLGPETWTVYTYLVYQATRPGGIWPKPEEVALACGLTTDQVQRSVDLLVEREVLGRHQWTSHPSQPVTYTILPVTASGPSTGLLPVEKPPSETPTHDDPIEGDPPAVEGFDPSNEDLEPEVQPVEQVDTAWFEQAREKRLARRLFSSFVSALGGEPTELSEDDRDRIRRATQIVGEAGGTPDQVRHLAEQISRLQPDAQVDPVWIAEHWEELTRDLPSRNDESA